MSDEDVEDDNDSDGTGGAGHKYKFAKQRDLVVALLSYCRSTGNNAVTRDIQVGKNCL